MKLIKLGGRTSVYKNCQKYRINWNKKSRSLYQFQVKQFLKQYWEDQIVYEEFPVFGSKMTLDLYNATRKIAIEMSGEQHLSYSKFFHQNSQYNYLFQIQRDAKKLKFCEINNIKLIEIFPKDLPLTERFFIKQGVSL